MFTKLRDCLRVMSVWCIFGVKMMSTMKNGKPIEIKMTGDELPELEPGNIHTKDYLAGEKEAKFKFSKMPSINYVAKKTKWFYVYSFFRVLRLNFINHLFLKNKVLITLNGENGKQLSTITGQKVFNYE